MRTLIVVFGILSSVLAFESPVCREEEWNVRNSDAKAGTNFYTGVFRTRMDHFQPLNQDVVVFRYHVNANYFEDDNPLYIYLKDYGDYSTQWIERGLMVDIANETGAALLTFDMRYFGENRPTSDTSFENMRLLNIEQTLADIATFIRFVREYVGHGVFSKVILWGSGYGGSLAVPPFDLLDTLMPNIGERDCRNRVQEAYKTLNELMLNGSVEYISNRFNLCHNIDTDDRDDVAAFYELSLRALIRYFEMYHSVGVQNFCFNMRVVLANPLLSFARWIVHVFGDGSCFDHTFDGIVERSANVSWNQYGTDTGRRQWYYLQCTQIGEFPLADQYTWIPQNVPMEILGPQYNSTLLPYAVSHLYQEFEHSIPDVLYTNGNIDPWRFFGRRFDDLLEVINIEYASKSADLPSLSLNDPRDLCYAKQQIRELIIDWSSGHEHDDHDIVN